MCEVVILAESPFWSPVSCDQESPPFTALELPVVSDTLPLVSSIQPINSRAPGDKTYIAHWNPVWEDSKDDIPVWEDSPLVFSVPMSPPDMEGGSPISTDESVVTSGEIPTVTEPIPVRSTSTSERLPPGYHALRDLMSSELPPMSSIWSQLTASTTGPFSPQDRVTSVTSAPTRPTISVASTTPVISQIMDFTSNVPHSSGPIPAERPFDFNSLLRILQYDPSQPFGGPPSPQPVVEVSVPLSVGWTVTHYHGGQVTSAPLPGPPSQDQSFGQSYPGQPGGQQGQPFQGQPSASGGSSFTYFSQPSGNPGQPSIQQGQPGIQQGYPSGQAGQPSIQQGQPGVQQGYPTRQVGQLYVQQNQPSIQYGPASGQAGQPSIQQGQPNVQYGQTFGQVGQSYVQQGQPNVQYGQPSGQVGPSYVQQGQPTVQYGQTSGQVGQPHVQQSQPTIQYSQAPRQVGQPQIQSCQPTVQPTQPSSPSGQPLVVQREPHPQQVQSLG